MLRRLSWYSTNTFGRTCLMPVYWSWLLFVVVAMTEGCAKVDHGNRVAIGGKISKDGDPVLEKATIYLEAQDGFSTGTSGEVKEGQFTIPKEAGPTPGKKYNVLVTTYPGIPAEGTPKDKIKYPQKLKGVVEVPDKGSMTLEVEVQ